MDLSNLQPAKGSTKQRKRIGRGIGSTRGGTSTKGNKGAQSRSGYSKKLVLKVDKCLYIEECLNLDLKILTGQNMLVLI